MMALLGLKMAPCEEEHSLLAALWSRTFGKLMEFFSRAEGVFARPVLSPIISFAACPFPPSAPRAYMASTQCNLPLQVKYMADIFL